MICNVEITSEIFSELNDKHIHTYKNEDVTNRVSGSLWRVCVCLTYTQVIHNTYTFLAQKHIFVQILAHCVNLQNVTTRVYVVYVFDKHIHAFKLLIISVYKCVFGGRVYVWRLILKKKSTIR